MHLRYRVRTMGFDRLMDFSLEWHDEENSGNKIQRIQAGSEAVRDWIKVIYSDILQIAANFFGVLFIFLFLKPAFVIFFLVYLCCFFTIQTIFNRKIVHFQGKLNVAKEKSTGVYFESASNVLSVKSLGAQENISEHVKHHEAETREYDLIIRDLSVLKWKCFQTLNGIALGVFLFLVGQGILQGGLTAGFILIFYSYFSNLRESAAKITEISERLIELGSALQRMMPIFTTDSNISSGTQDFPRTWEFISIRDGFFTYRSRDASSKKFSIRSFSFFLRRGEKVGVVGASGGGKSTLAKLLLGVYSLQKGKFLVGDVDFYDIRHDEVVKHISIVLQESELFNMSLRDNVTLMRDVSPNLLKTALSVAQLEPIIKKLSQGLDTLIGEKGYRLSGGERQRVGIARAICKDPEVLVLDEATSALDSVTERKVLEGIESQLTTKTLLIIAHRFSTLQRVDRVLVFERGSIIEEGTFTSLLRKKTSRFKELYELQKRGVEVH